MSFYEQLAAETADARNTVLSSPIVADCLRGEVSLPSYLAFLGQAFHHVRHTTPLLMSLGGRLPERLAWLRRAVAEYIEEEIGHEEWILNDIAACGGDAEAVRLGQPSQAIELMVSYLYDTIARGNPVGLFGMVNVLEGTSIALATQAAGTIQQRLALPPQAFSYLTSHGALDIGHMQHYRELMNRLERDEDKAAVIHVSKVVYRLYADMFRGLPRTVQNEVQHALA